MKRSDVLTLLVVGLAFLSIALPAVLVARELSRSQMCEKNLQKLARGCLDYASVRRDELPANRRQPATGWNTLVLPFAERQELFNSYDLASSWWEASRSKNQQLAATILPELLCPAAPNGERMLRLKSPDGAEFSAAATDYVASAGAYLENSVVERLYRGAMAQSGRFYGASGVTSEHPVRLYEITDGTSHTILIVEMADKPNQRPELADTLAASETQPTELVEGFSFGQWIAPNWNHLRSYSKDGLQAFGPCGVNCSNRASVFAFHKGFANVAFADGSVRRVREKLEQEILVALVSIADGELLNPIDFVRQESP